MFFIWIEYPDGQENTNAFSWLDSWKKIEE